MYRFFLKVIMILSVVFYTTYSDAFEDDITSSRIVSDSDKIVVRIFGIMASSETSISKNDNSELPNGEKSIVYKTREDKSAGIGISYKNFGFTYGNGNKKVFSISYLTSKFANQLIYQDFKGATLADSEKFTSPSQPVDADRKDFRSRNLCFNSFYVFSDDYSLRSVFDQSERQVKWAWSLMILGTVNCSRISASKSLIPPVYDTYDIFGNETGYSGGDYLSAGIIPGVGINLPLSSFFFDAGFFIGPGYLKEKQNVSGGSNRKHSMSILTYLYYSVGFNGENFFAGFYCNQNKMDIGNNIEDDLSARYMIRAVVFNFFVGCKF